MYPWYTSVNPEELGIFDGVQRRDIEQRQVLSYRQIESALLEHPLVLEAGVVIKDIALQPNLKVYLALANSSQNEQLLGPEIEEFISNHFTLNIPINVQICKNLPMTRSGKIARTMLENWG